MVQPIRLRLTGSGLVLLVTACGSDASSVAANSGDAEKSPGTAAVSYPPRDKAEAVREPAQKPDLADARVLIDKIYSQYADPLKDVDIPLTPELEASIDKQSGEEGLGYDIFCQCNDPGDPGLLKHTIQSLKATADGAVARISVVIGEPSGVTLTIRLARRGTQWMVADVIGDDGSLLEKGK